jgi:hypothetical protein
MRASPLKSLSCKEASWVTASKGVSEFFSAASVERSEFAARWAEWDWWIEPTLSKSRSREAGLGSDIVDFRHLSRKIAS